MSAKPLQSLNMAAQDWVLLFLLSAIWGGSFLFGRVAVQEVPPMTLVLARVGIAAIALNGFLLFFASKITHSKSLWLGFAGMGILNNIIPFGLIFYGQLEIGAGLAAIINAMTPIWTLLIAHWTTGDEKLSRNKIIGIVLGFAGVALLIGVDALTGLQSSLIAQLAVLGATISYGCASVFGRRFYQVPAIETARGQLTMSTLLMIPIAAYADRFWTLPFPSPPVFWSILGLAVICTAFAYILFFRILARAGAVNIALVTFLVPISAVLLGNWVLGEVLTPNQLAGMGLILFGLLVVDGRLFTWARR